MGKGDKKTKKGKRFRKSFGNVRSQKKLVYSFKYKRVKEETIKWFKPKSYTHFGRPFNRKDKYWLEKKLSNKQYIIKYDFYPLIHRTLSERRYKKLKDTSGKYYRAHYDKVKKKSTIKKRHIFFANHLDSAIYAYYTKLKLSPKYEAILATDKNLSEAISAYRKILVTKKSKKGKSNIHFAKDVFDEIKKRKECVALAFDIRGFFDNLDHTYLKIAWAKLLGKNNGVLPASHDNIYRSITNFTYVEENQLLKEENLIHIRDRRKRKKELKKRDSYCRGRTNQERNRDFRNRICGKGFIKPHFEYEKNVSNGKGKGIPQGLPISAFLANLYLLEFDKVILQKIKSLKGIYRRYSDDIIVICPRKEEKEISKFIRNELKNKYFLEINYDKTEKAYFEKQQDGSIINTPLSPLRYLGFEYNGKGVYLKSSALAKYHRRKKQAIKRSVFKTKMMRKYGGKPFAKVWTSKIRKKYSSKGNRNFISYAKRAAKVMRGTDENKIEHQIMKHHKLLEQYLKKKTGRDFIMPR